MECSIKHSYLRNLRKHFRNRPDTQYICRIMKRCEYRTLLKLSDNCVSDKLAAYEFLSSMNHSMSDSLDILESRKYSELLVKKGVKDSFDTDCMIFDREFLYQFLLTCSLMLEATNLHTDSFDKTLGKKVKNIIILHIKKLILQ